MNSSDELPEEGMSQDDIIRVLEILRDFKDSDLASEIRNYIDTGKLYDDHLQSNFLEFIESQELSPVIVGKVLLAFKEYLDSLIRQAEASK